MPFATWWLKHHEKFALRRGRKLSDEELLWSQKIGIKHADKVRILAINKIPTPLPSFIENFLQHRGFPAGNASGMCMRYGIYAKETNAHSKFLIAHELVHTQQYERLGSIWAFLKAYLQETTLLGYIHSPLEKEANATAEAILNNDFPTTT